jgi:hypothetical protein
VPGSVTGQIFTEAQVRMRQAREIGQLVAGGPPAFQSLRGHGLLHRAAHRARFH